VDHALDVAEECWGPEVVTTTVLGYPCLSFARRRRHLGELLVDARRFPDREYLIQGPRRLSFAAHEQAVGSTVGLLGERGVGPGDRVLLLAANSIEWVVSFWAIIDAGAVVVLGNCWWSESEIEHAMRTVDPRLVVADERRRAQLPAGVACLTVSDVSSAVSSRPVPVPVPDRAAEDDPAVVLFTSGTTGMPKGAVLSHRGIISTLQSLLVRIRRLPSPGVPPPPGSRALLSLPLFHVGGLQQILTPMVTGGTLVFNEGRFDAARVVDIIQDEGISVWSAVPTMVSRVADYLEQSGHGPLGGVRTVGLGGSPVPVQLRERVVEWFPSARRGLAVTYGLSEACGVVSTGACEEVTKRAGTVGRPLETVTIRIDAPDEAGAGEILVRSPAVMLGYWNPEAHGGGLDPGPVTEDRWLRTGDVGRIDDDGYLYVTDRFKDIVIRGGENIATPHVENRLLEHPAVQEVAVIGLPHPELGEEVGAVVVLHAGSTASTDELTRFAAETLAYFEVPTKWEIRTGGLPHNATGKILKRTVRQEWVDQLERAEEGPAGG
jgi:long-chain acyl-CoA synthetase